MFSRADDDLIEAAVREGKFPPTRAAHYRHQMESDPVGTRRLIAELAPGIPMAELGALTSASAAPPTDYPRKWLKDVKPATGRVTHEEF